jgi:hypothetical protein
LLVERQRRELVLEDLPHVGELLVGGSSNPRVVGLPVLQQPPVFETIA